jgi:hypothetical protein
MLRAAVRVTMAPQITHHLRDLPMSWLGRAAATTTVGAAILPRTTTTLLNGTTYPRSPRGAAATSTAVVFAVVWATYPSSNISRGVVTAHSARIRIGTRPTAWHSRLCTVPARLASRSPTLSVCGTPFCRCGRVLELAKPLLSDSLPLLNLGALAHADERHG